MEWAGPSYNRPGGCVDVTPGSCRRYSPCLSPSSVPGRGSETCEQVPHPGVEAGGCPPASAPLDASCPETSVSSWEKTLNLLGFVYFFRGVIIVLAATRTHQHPGSFAVGGRRGEEVRVAMGAFLPSRWPRALAGGGHALGIAGCLPPAFACGS